MANWPDTDNETLTRMWNVEHKTVPEISVIMERTETAVSNRIVVLKLPRRRRVRWTLEELKRLAELKAQGLTVSQMMPILKRGEGAIRNKMVGLVVRIASQNEKQKIWHRRCPRCGTIFLCHDLAVIVCDDCY